MDARTRQRLVGCGVAAALAFLLAGSLASTQENPLLDLIQIVVLPNELAAVDAGSAASVRTPFLLGEKLVFQQTRGRVGIALTDRRMLAVATRSAAWQEERVGVHEQAPTGALLGDEIAVLWSNRRILGFDGRTSNFVERGLGPRERILSWSVGANVGVVVTDRRALGLSSQAGGWFEAKLRLREGLTAVEASGNVATVRTERRVLTFSGPSGTWTSLGLDLY